MIVGIAGEMGSGKDTVLRALSVYEDVCRVALADPGKAFWYGRDDLHKAMPLPGVPDMRTLLQVSLTEDRESAYASRVWTDMLRWQIETLQRRLGYEDFVVTDVRRDYEAEDLRLFGSERGQHVEIWRVESPRAGNTPHSGHVSETGVAEVRYDRLIENDGTIEDLVDKALVCWTLAEDVQKEMDRQRAKLNEALDRSAVDCEAHAITEDAWKWLL